jgi:ABC-type dipeptide/oligopeptide/nickel transport system permease subunit
MRFAAAAVLAVTLLASFAPVSYDQQFREAIDTPPSKEFPLGTDSLGRDRLARLLYGTRISLLLAPAAALVSTLAAAAIGIAAGLSGGRIDAFLMRGTDIFLSLPWLFLFLTLRAILPLNADPGVSMVLTFLIMGLLGWAPAARVIRASVRRLRDSDFVLQARAQGCSESRIRRAFLAPRVSALLVAQFFLSVPLFIVGEASLGLLGLGVSEPLPSWGNLLRELENLPALSNYWMFAPIALLVIVMTSFQLILPRRDLRV